jgi:hypothetical protein
MSRIFRRTAIDLSRKFPYGARRREQMRALVLSDSAAEKLARLSLGWLKKTGRRTEQNINLKLSLTH